MRFAKVFAAVALLAVSGAYAQESPRTHTTGGVILRDTIAGGLAGSAVAGGIILYNMGIQDKSDYDWGRTLAWGALIGLGAGLVFGAIDATSGPIYAMGPFAASPPVRDGLSISLDVRRRDQSGAQEIPILMRRF